MTDLGFLAALAGGILALLSPCSALLLPSFFAFAFTSKRRLAARTVVFYLGLAVALVPLGVGSTAVNRLFAQHRDTLIAVAGGVVIALGVVQLLGGGIRIGFLQRVQAKAAGRDGVAGVFALGTVYGLAGFCTGPILGAVLTMAAVSGNPVRGGVMLAIYALGMVVPLFALALLWDRFHLGRKRWLRGRPYNLGPLRLHSTSTISGLLFIAVGVLFVRYRGMSVFAGPVNADVMGDIQEWVVATFGQVSDLPVIGVVAAAAVVGVLLWHRRGARAAQQPAEHPQDSKVSSPDSTT